MFNFSRRFQFSKAVVLIYTTRGSIWRSKYTKALLPCQHLVIFVFLFQPSCGQSHCSSADFWKMHCVLSGKWSSRGFSGEDQKRCSGKGGAVGVFRCEPHELHKLPVSQIHKWYVPKVLYVIENYSKVYSRNRLWARQFAISWWVQHSFYRLAALKGINTCISDGRFWDISGLCTSIGKNNW